MKWSAIICIVTHNDAGNLCTIHKISTLECLVIFSIQERNHKDQYCPCHTFYAFE